MAFQFCSVGFVHSSWLGSFYPDELPRDWWLDFYANFSECLVVTSADLLVEVDSWLESVVERKDFAFFLGEELSESQQTALQSSLGKQVKGVLGQDYSQVAHNCYFSEVAQTWVFVLDDVNNLRELKNSLIDIEKAYAPESAVFALKGDGCSANLLEQAPVLLTLLGWDGERHLIK